MACRGPLITGTQEKSAEFKIDELVPRAFRGFADSRAQAVAAPFPAGMFYENRTLTVSDEAIGRYHRVGLAQEFNVRGVFKTQIEWQSTHAESVDRVAQQNGSGGGR